MIKSFLYSLLPGALLAAVALNVADAAGPPQVTQTGKGAALTDAKGMTLYTFDKDSPGKSACTGKCAENWPPLTADPGAAAPAGYSVITRDDGQKQWAYKGKPLYGWVKDMRPSDATGDGVNNSWHIAKP